MIGSKQKRKSEKMSGKLGSSDKEGSESTPRAKEDVKGKGRGIGEEQSRHGTKDRQDNQTV